MIRAAVFSVVLSLAAGCTGLGLLGIHHGSSERAVDGTEPPRDGPPELRVTPLYKYNGSEGVDAKNLVAELEEAHATPAKRRRSDLAIMLELHNRVNTMYVRGQPADWSAALEAWKRAKKIAQLPANTGTADELTSEPLRRAGLVLVDLYHFSLGRSPREDAAAERQQLEKLVAEHEATFLAGKSSARGRALLEEADVLERTHPDAYAESRKLRAAQASYDADPATAKLAADWRELNSKAEEIAESLGEEHPSDWAHSSEPSLATYRQRLAKYQETERRLRKKHGLPE